MNPEDEFTNSFALPTFSNLLFSKTTPVSLPPPPPKQQQRVEKRVENTKKENLTNVFIGTFAWANTENMIQVQCGKCHGNKIESLKSVSRITVPKRDVKQVETSIVKNVISGDKKNDNDGDKKEQVPKKRKRRGKKKKKNVVEKEKDDESDKEKSGESLDKSVEEKSGDQQKQVQEKVVEKKVTMIDMSEPLKQSPQPRAPPTNNTTTTSLATRVFCTGKCKEEVEIKKTCRLQLTMIPSGTPKIETSLPIIPPSLPTSLQCYHQAYVEEEEIVKELKTKEEALWNVNHPKLYNVFNGIELTSLMAWGQVVERDLLGMTIEEYFFLSTSLSNRGVDLAMVFKEVLMNSGPWMVNLANWSDNDFKESVKRGYLRDRKINSLSPLFSKKWKNLKQVLEERGLFLIKE